MTLFQSFKKMFRNDEQGKKYNVILITLDAMRLDKISVCPEFAKLTQQGYFMNNMITAAPYTIGSMHSILSGLYPSTNGVNAYYNMFKFRKDRCKTLTEYFKEAGYYTVADVVNKNIIPNQGFEQVLVHDQDKGNLLQRHTDIISKAAKKKNFFIYFQYSHIHNQLVDNIAKKYDDFSEDYFNNPQFNLERYEQYVKESNYYVKNIMEHIRSLGLDKNTIVVFHADHGSSTGEKKGEKMYGCFLYDYTIKIFCLFLTPTRQTAKITLQTRTIDMMPTIMEMVNIPADAAFEPLQGNSLLPMFQGQEREERSAFCETGGLYGPWPSPEAHNVFCIRKENKKIIYNHATKKWEFYDLLADVQENKNLVLVKGSKHKKEIEEYKLWLREEMERNGIGFEKEMKSAEKKTLDRVKS